MCACVCLQGRWVREAASRVRARASRVRARASRVQRHTSHIVLRIAERMGCGFKAATERGAHRQSRRRPGGGGAHASVRRPPARAPRVHNSHATPREHRASNKPSPRHDLVAMILSSSTIIDSKCVMSPAKRKIFIVACAVWVYKGVQRFSCQCLEPARCGALAFVRAGKEDRR